MKYIIWIVGFIIVCILCFPIIEYGVVRFVPDPIEYREKEAIKQFNFLMRDGGIGKEILKKQGHEFPEGVIPEIVSIKLKKVLYWPQTFSWFNIKFRVNKNETSCAAVGAMNQDHLLVGDWHRWFWNHKEK